MIEDKLVTVKFLEDMKRMALANMDMMPPKDRSDLYQAKMFALGFIYALTDSDYELKEKE